LGFDTLVCFVDHVDGFQDWDLGQMKLVMGQIGVWFLGDVVLSQGDIWCHPELPFGASL
jgi:hypothetical protein